MNNQQCLLTNIKLASQNIHDFTKVLSRNIYFVKKSRKFGAIWYHSTQHAQALDIHTSPFVASYCVFTTCSYIYTYNYNNIHVGNVINGDLQCSSSISSRMLQVKTTVSISANETLYSIICTKHSYCKL